MVRHEAIPGFMPAMTMEFTVRDEKEIEGLREGDQITFQLTSTEEESWIDQIQLINRGSVSTEITSDPTARLKDPKLKPGERISDVELLSEDDQSINLTTFRGKALAFTFIFTRCPLPDFCPRMNQGFKKAREVLFNTPDAPANYQFLTISFDPEVDRPAMLKRHAEAYRGQNHQAWLFASASTNVMSILSEELDFRFAKESGTFLHNLRTVVLDPHGRVYRQLDGNKWTGEELAQALIESARVTE